MLFRRTTATPPLPSEPVEYPSGVFVHTEKGYFYVSGPGKRFRIIHKRVLNSWSPQRVVETTEAALANYRVTAKLKFRNGSLIHSIGDGKMYFISDGKRRLIRNPDAFAAIGATPDDAVMVSIDETNLHEEGAPLN